MSLDLNQFENLKKALPTKKDEAWKFTSLSDFKSIPWTFAPTEELVGLSHDELQKISLQLPSEFYNLVFVNGVLNNTLSDDLAGGFQITANMEAASLSEEHPEYKLLALAQACTSQKLQIRISEHQVFEKPVQLVFVQNAKSPQFFSQKVEVQVAKNAEVILLTQSLSLHDEQQTALNLNIQVEVEAAARVKLIQIQNDSVNSYHFSQASVNLKSDAQFQGLTMTLGALLCRNYFDLKFLGQGADAGVFGLSAINQKQHADNYTFIQHKTGGNNSRQLYKSILAGASHSVFRGRVRIEKDAQKANSEQLNNNLLLTREAQADTVPQLEIYADDVKAGHGATVGQLNRDEIFYFLSRGINQIEAVKMLSFGFAQEFIYQIENKEIQNWLLKKLNQKLDGMIND